MKPANFVNRDRLLADFLDLVRIDSPSGQEAAIGQRLSQRLQALGCTVEQDAVGNLIARLPGQGGETILLSCHMDTVGSDTGIVPVIRDGIIYSEGPTILGSDDKSGVAVLLETLTLLSEHPDWRHPSLEIVITVSEELGLWGARHLDTAQLQAKWGVVLDAGGPIGTLVYSAPSQNRIEAVVHGRKAHAGSEPENGVNAIVAAAAAITAMPVGRIDDETTANIGVIHGGEATNIVPDRVEIYGEARSRDEDKLARQTETMVDALQQAAAQHGASASISVIPLYRTYRLAPEDRPYAAAAAALARLGFTVQAKMAGGGTDGNIYTNAGIPCVVLSTGMAQVHTPDEHIAIQDMVDSARVLVTLLTDNEG